MKHSKQLRPVDSLGDVEQAGGGESPLGAQVVQGSLSALAGGRVVAEDLVLAYPVLPARQVARHVLPHVQVEEVAAQVEGEVELLLILEQLYKL